MMNVANSFEEFNAILRKHEIDNVEKYVITKHGPKTFSSLKIELSEGLRLHWEDNVPYFHFGTRIYGCHHGKDRHTSKKRLYALKRDEKAQQDHCFVKRERKIQVSKKHDCPAIVRVTRVYRMPNHKVSGQITKNNKETISALIKKEISEGKDLGGKDCYQFNLPCTVDHKCHLLDNFATSTSMGKGKSSGRVQMSKLGGLKCRSNKKKILNDCNATIRSIQSVMGYLNDQNLKLLSDSLRNTFTLISSQVEFDSFTGLPIAKNAAKKQNNKRKATNILDEMQEKDF